MRIKSWCMRSDRHLELGTRRASRTSPSISTDQQRVQDCVENLVTAGERLQVVSAADGHCSIRWRWTN